MTSERLSSTPPPPMSFEDVEEMEAKTVNSDELSPELQAKLEAIDEKLTRFQEQRRWSDVIRTMLEKAELVPTDEERIAVWTEAGDLYIERSSNQAEAIKCFEKVLELDEFNVGAVLKLKELYEKRLDWESLIGVMEREASMLDRFDRAERFVEMARIATEKLRKPDICIARWEKVLEFDEENEEAQDSLLKWYERGRMWEPLAVVTEKVAARTQDEATLKGLLQKLASYYGDKLNDEEKAVDVARRLLVLDPNDRRAQDQLKRRYVEAGAWDDLEEFYQMLDKWDELIRTFEREADGGKRDEAESIDLYLRAARLWSDKKERPDRAARIYEKVCSLAPGNVDAAEALVDMYRSAGDKRKLAAAQEHRITQIEDADERVAMLWEVANLYEEELRDPRKAFDKLVEACLLDPARAELREGMERLGESTRAQAKVMETYEAILAGHDDVDLQIEVGTRFAAMLKESGHEERAAEMLARVYDLDPSLQEVVQSLMGLYRDAGKFSALVELCDKRLAHAVDEEERLLVSYERAALLEDDLRDVDAAVQMYQDIVDTYGDDQWAAYDALERLYTEKENWLGLSEMLQRRLDGSMLSEQQAVDLRHRLGVVLSERMHERSRALELFRDALSLAPDHEGARQALESLLDDAEVGRQAAEILEPLYEVTGEPEQLVRTLRVLATNTHDPVEKQGLLCRIAETYAQRMDDVRKSFEALAEALHVLPSDEHTIQQTEATAAAAECLPQLARTYEDIAAHADDPGLRRDYWLRLAHLCDQQLDDVDAAIAAYQKVLESNVGDALDALVPLEQLFRRTERFGELVRVMRMRADMLIDPVEREELLCEVAATYVDMLQRPEDAIRTYREVLDIDPMSHRALRSLDGLFEAQEMWSELADNIDRQLAVADDPEEEITCMLRLAAIREQRMHAVEAAIAMYQEVLQRDPENRRALEALELHVEGEAHRSAVTTILESVYRESGDVNNLIRIHQVQIAQTSMTGRKHELLQTVADLQENVLGQGPAAFETLSQALHLVPSDLRLVDELERLARDVVGVPAFLQVLESALRALPEEEEESAEFVLRTRAAHGYETDLDDAARAIGHYERALILDPGHIEVIEALERLYHLGERYEALAGIYLKKAELVPSVDDQKDYLFRTATIYDQVLEQPQQAVITLQKVLEIDPEDLHACDKLIEAHLQLEQWSELLDVYRRKVECIFDLAEKKQIYTQMAAVYESELQQIDQAIDTYQRVLEVDPDDRDAIERLDVLYQSTENWSELLAILEREADLAADPFEVIGHRYRIAEVWHRKLDSEARAVELYREILDVAPEHRPTIEALESIVRESETPVGAAVVLEEVYRATQAFDKLVWALETQVKFEEDAFRRVDMLHRIGDLQEVHLDAPDAAFQSFVRALSVDPVHEHTLASLERLAEQTSAWPALVEAYDSLVTANREQDLIVVQELALRAGAALEVHVEDLDEAIKRYTTVCEVDPLHRQATDALDRLHEQLGHWEALRDVLMRQIDVADGDEALLLHRHRLGRLLQEKLDDAPAAVAQFRDVLSLDPYHEATVQVLELMFAEGQETFAVADLLEPIYRSQDRWDGVIAILQAGLSRETQADRRVEIMHNIADLAETQLGDFETAFEWTRNALAEDLESSRSLEECERFARALDGWDLLANAYAQMLDGSTSDAAKVTIGHALARVYEVELGDVERAEQAHRFVLQADEKDPVSLEALDVIYESQGAHEALAEVLRRRIATCEDPDQQIELAFRLGQTLEQDLHRIDEAEEVYQRILADFDPQHLATLRKLQSVYTAKQDWAKLLSAFENEQEIVYSDEEQSEILAKMAYLASEKTEDLEQAIDLWRRVLEVRGEDVQALNAMGVIFAKLERWADLADVLEREASVEEDESQRATIYEDLARLWSDKLGRDQNAIDTWERVLEVDPMRVMALLEIANIHRNNQQWSELTDTLHRTVAMGEMLDGVMLENALLNLGHTYLTALQQPMDAAEAFRHAAELRPDCTQALDSLESIYREEAAWEDVIGVLALRLDQVAYQEEKIALLGEMANLWERKLADRVRAAQTYEKILEIDPQHRFAFRQAEALFREAGAWELLVQLYMGRVEVAESMSERVKCLHVIAQAYEQHLDDREGAFDALQIAWTEDFHNKRTVRELERLAAVTGKWNELLQTANNALQSVTEEKARTVICLHCARWYGQQLGHPEYALRYYQEILEVDPTNLDAMRQMADVYRITSQWSPLAQLLLRLSEMVENTKEKAEFLYQMGELCEEQMRVPDQARNYYAQSFKLDPYCLPTLMALERIYYEAGRVPELVEVMENRAQAEEDTDDVVAARIRLAEAYETLHERPEEAIVQYEKVLEIDPKHMESLRELSRLYTAESKWAKLRGVLETQIEIAPSERDEIEARLMLASIWEEQFIKLDEAIVQLERVLDINASETRALERLAKAQRGLQRWEDLVQTLDRHISAGVDRDTKVQLFRSMAEVCAWEIKDLDRAIDAYLALLSLKEDDLSCLDELARLYEQREDYGAALDMLHQRIRATDDKADRIKLLCRTAHLLSGKLREFAEASECLNRALDLDPNHLEALEALCEAYIELRDWPEAARSLERMAELHQNTRSQAECLVRLGRIMRDELHEESRAFEAFEAAYRADGQNAEAGLPVARAYVAEGRDEEALPVLQMLVRSGDIEDNAVMQELWFSLGSVCKVLGREEESTAAFLASHGLDAAHLPTLFELASSYYRAENWEEAFRFFQMLLVHHRDELTSLEVADVFFHLGTIKEAQGERRKAINMFDKALEEEPQHRPTLLAALDIHEATRQWEQAVHTRQALVQVAESDEEHIELLLSIGDIWKDQVKNLNRAIEAYKDCVAVAPSDPQALHKLLAIYQETEQWDEAVGMIDRIVEIDDRPKAKAQGAYTAGSITRKMLKRPDDAIDRFNEALDHDFKHLKAFQAIDQILTEKKDWKQLERAYRKMLHRIVGQGEKDLEFDLWHNLGIIYRDRMRNFESAAEAFTMASQLRPDEVKEHRILAELYASMPGRVDHAVQHHQAIIRLMPSNAESLGALYALYFDASAYDKAWCAAATLTFLGKANEEQRRFFEQYKQQGVIRPQTRLNNEDWLKDLMHPDEDLYLGKIFQIVAPALHALRASTDKALRLSKKHEVDLTNATATFARSYAFGAQVLGIATVPRLFMHPDTPGGVAHVPGSTPPAVIVGSSLLHGRSPQELAFVVGRYLGYYRGEHFIRTLVSSTAELKGILLASLAIAGVGPSGGEIEKLADTLRSKMTPAQLEALRSVCRKFVENDNRADIKLWMKTVEVSSCRAGLLLCNDLSVAARMVQELPSEGSVSVSPREKVEELVAFSVSEKYFQLREKLGVQIRV